MRAFALAALIFATPVLATPALAFEQTVEFRFGGDEIADIRHIPQSGEDPEGVEIFLSSLEEGTMALTVEGDNGLGDCLQVLSDARGNPEVTVVITQHLNAMTMNGITLAQCSWR
jgi:hypothetical protein